MKRIHINFILLVLFSCFYCTSPRNEKVSESTAQNSPKTVAWQEIDTVNIQQINSDLQPGLPTVDIGIYFPSNFDSSFHKVSLKRMIESFVFAKEIYKPTGVQLNLLWVKTGELNPKYFAIQSNEIPGIPDTEYANLYESSRRHPSVLPSRTIEAFQSIIEPDEANSRTIYLVALEEVFYPFLTVSEGRNWMVKSVRTGGMSFPSYSFTDQIPQPYRGIITITNLSREDRYRKTIAHELGHKLINVSHEYNETHPGFEVFADGGLMLYGKGEDIPSGKSGRWHLERLLLSPYLYKTGADGSKKWNPDYKENGHYYDPIYGEYVIHFLPEPEIGEDW